MTDENVVDDGILGRQRQVTQGGGVKELWVVTRSECGEIRTDFQLRIRVR
jgi:hypothetical protein